MLLILAFFPGAAGDPKDEQIVLEATLTCSGSGHAEQKTDSLGWRREELMTDQFTLTLHEVSRWRIVPRQASPLDVELVSSQPTLTVSGGGHYQEVLSSRSISCDQRLLTNRTERNWTYNAVPLGEFTWARPNVSIERGWYNLNPASIDIRAFVNSPATTRSTYETCEGATEPDNTVHLSHEGPAFMACWEAINPNEKVMAKLAGTFPENRPASSYSGETSFRLYGGFLLGQVMVNEPPVVKPGDPTIAATVNISYRLSLPGGGNNEVVITPPANLGSWLPLGGKDQDTPGDVLKFTGEIKPLGGKKGDDKIKVEVRLESSREPGIAMNFPPGQKGDDRPDLRILKAQSSSKLVIKEEAGSGDTAVYVAEGEFKPGETFTVAVGSFDYGAHGTIEFTSAAPVRINGYPNRSSVGLPRDDNGNGIADDWEASQSEKAEDDQDSQPKGDGTEGDGLSAFEEYRGFLVQGVHERTGPDRKDVFIYDQSNLGIGYFEKSGLAIHLVSASEFIAQPEPGALNPLVINFNAGTAHLGSQHVLHLVAGDIGGDLGGTIQANDLPGPPKTVERVIIGLDAIAALAKAFPEVDAAQLRRVTIAHELGHSTNVFHHGGPNYPITAKIEKKAADGTWQPWGPPNAPALLGQDLQVVLASFGGLNSGDDRCIMRYNTADFYRVPQPKGTFQIRYNFYADYHPFEPPGTIFCTNKAGTGVNAKDRQPGPKAGTASCGDCMHQFCVNDVKECGYKGTECKNQKVTE